MSPAMCWQACGGLSELTRCWLPLTRTENLIKPVHASWDCKHHTDTSLALRTVLDKDTFRFC